MMRCLYSGVSGLTVHQTKMDVIGNNISNVNTVGYKSSSVSFSDVLSQTMSGASAANEETGSGGTNPMQVGLGVGISAVSTNMTQGSLQSTGNETDLAIEGNGFFIVQGAGSDAYQFTRAGDFTVDASGNLVTSDGMLVCGWLDYGGSAQADGTYEFDTEQEVEAINLYSDEYNLNKNVTAPQATDSMALSGNLDSSIDASGIALDDIDTVPSEADFSTPMTVYDNLGNEYEVNANFYKCYVDDSNASDIVTSWYWEIPSVDGLDIDTSGYIQLDSDGQIIDGNTSFPISQDITLTPDSSVGAEEFTITLDFESLTMYNIDSSVESSGNGYTAGELSDFTIGEDGVITGIYTNGEQKPLGMIALAIFQNPSGLQKTGSNLYMATTNSGEFINGIAAGTTGGSISTGVLEMSNVDLSSEFTEMIVTQRGYQANSRIITTADEMLQELVNLKR